MLCIVISLIIFANLMTERDRRSRMNRLFRFFALCNIGLLTNDTIWYFIEGNTGRHIYLLLRASGFLHYALGPLMLAAMTLYMLAYIGLKAEVRRAVPAAVLFICGLALGLTVVSQFTDMYYFIDEYNIYNRGDLFRLSQLLPAAGLLLNMGIIISYRKAMRRKVAVFFIAQMGIPVIVMSIQYTFFGLTLFPIGATLALLIFYVTVQTELVVNLETAITSISQRVELQGEYYKMLSAHIDEAKAARHDLRHHLTVVKSYINSDNKDRLKTYLSEHIGSLSLDEEIVFCENFAVNSLLRYYLGVAKNEGIQTEVNLDLPKTPGISDSDLCVIFGNCVENAIENCRRIDSGKFIKISSKIKGKMLAITIDNSFDGSIKKDGDTLLSLKRDGRGIGISSVRAVAGKYGGTARFEPKHNIFQMSVLLRIGGD